MSEAYGDRRPTSALLRLLLPKWKNVTTMAAPIGTHVREVFETMRDAVIQLGFIRIGLCVRLCDTLGDDFWIALLVACVVAV